MSARDGRDDDGIAIVGVSGRFPGAPDVATFWNNVCAGVESLTILDERDLEDAFDAETRSSPNFVRARGLLADVDRFDASFFGMHAREAELTDPQHRVLLETCWEALEDSGYVPGTGPTIGIVAGCSINTYFLRHVLRDRATIETFASDYQVGSFPMLVGGGQDFLATRIAYKLDLRGPALTVQSACSTALLAVGQAAQALAFGQADMMLAGAVSISFPQRRGYVHQDGGMVSSDGHCRTFDAASSGTVFGAGAGVVVLKRLADARADGDSVYAVIRGVGITNDGAAKVGYAAPSVEGQAAAIVAAQRAAGFAPETIDFVECHGTATPLGDPIEVAGLAKAFRGVAATGKRCALGSVKPNVGHLDVAAGMAGLIKTALAIRHAVVPPTLHFQSPNPRIDFAATPFYVNADLAPWPGDGTTRRAGVSAFGVGGTNVHAVLEAEPLPPRAAAARGMHLLPLSARSDAALASVASRLANHVRANPGIELADVAFTLARGRRHFARRRALVARTPDEALARLEAFAKQPPRPGGSPPNPAVAFVFPGQGAQYAGMGRELYARYPVFRGALDECAAIVRPWLGADLVALMQPARDDDAAARALTATAVAQPALFSFCYALARLWMSWGVVPVATLGHSVGEFVSATLASVFTLEDALRLVTERGRLMQALPGGSMVAVRLAEAEVLPLLHASLAIAAVNAPRQTVVAGTHEDVAALLTTLGARDVTFKRVATSHAFHSPMMDALRGPLEELVATMTLAPPAEPYVSTVTGRWIEPAEAVSPAYWAAHARSTVRFAEAVATLGEATPGALLEVGPGSALASAARQGAGPAADYAIVASLPATGAGDVADMLGAAGSLWEAGAELAWDALGSAGARRTSLPTYPFERKRYWLEASTEMASATAAPAEPATARAAAPETVVLSSGASSAGTSSVERELAALLEELSGEPVDVARADTSFLELGLDSLFLGRFVQKMNARYDSAVTFRQLLGELSSIAKLAAHLAPGVGPRASAGTVGGEPVPIEPPAGSAYDALVREQLQAMNALMREQLLALRAAPVAAAPPVNSAPAAPAVDSAPSRFDAFRITATAAPNSALTDAERAHIAVLVETVTARTPKSKAYTQRYRAVLADPRVAAGFRAEWKEMVYPIVCDRASGSRLWDLDGNEYVDLLNGFGQTAFGHTPPFVADAVSEQLQRGFAIGPQTDLAGEVAELFCKMTGNERVTFCNTGSEAVMAALRVARTVTGRDRIVVFSGAYHGQFDEVLVKGARTPERSIPIAPGIPAEAVGNVTVLTYGAAESLAWIREHAAELAAVIVEPVQSRHPSLAPKAFLQELRAVTEVAGTALVFDEVVTGFRMHPGGLQAAFGIRADLATYGKVVGGGLPIGILGGTTRFMDALDGGMWRYGDASEPEVPPTFFAGTFVRHPLVMAAVLAVLRHLDAQGPALQAELTARTERLVERLNAGFESRGWAGRIETYGSLFYFNFSSAERLAGLLYYHLRARGVYIQEGFPCFLTTAHSEADLDAVARAFSDSFDALQAVGIFGTGRSLPPTDAQNEIWLAAQAGDEASCAYNESLTLRLTGRLNETAFAVAFAAVVARHEALRAHFGTTGETLHVPAERSITYGTTDLSAGGPAVAQTMLADFIARDAREPFDLARGPLVRGHVLRLAPDVAAFVLTAHHIVCDGWSINVILSELAAAYASACAGRPHALPPPLPFTTYARRLQAREPAARARVEAYWHGQFAEPVQPLDLPTDRPRAAIKTYNGATRSMRIDERSYFALKKAAIRNGCTLFVTLFATFNALLGRLAQRREVVVGVPAAGQAAFEGEILVGHCVDFLPVRTAWDERTRLCDLLTSAKQTILGAYEHQEYTLGTLVRTLEPARAPNRLPLTEVQFNLERLGDRLNFPGLVAEVVPNPKAYVVFDLFFNIIESSDGLRIDCDYNADLFDAITIGRWLQYYRTFLDAVVEDASAPVDAVAYAPLPERQAETRSIAVGPEQARRPDATVASLFEARVAEAPEALAATCGDERVTYAELDERANRLARQLIARGAAPDDLIGVALDRSIDMLVAVLAAHKAGCAYLPLDPKHPRARLQHILAEARVRVLVVDAPENATLVAPNVPVCFLSDRSGDAAQANALPGPRSSSALAYVIYTSGSTGVPKGVEIEHGSVVNLLQSIVRRPGVGPGDVLLAVTTISFDIAALELFAPLVAGGTVVIATSEEAADGARLLQRLQTSGATMMQATPSTWRMLLEAGFCSTETFTMLCGGEALRPDLADRLLDGAGALWNMYGPTETTIWSSCAPIERGRAITVGTPLANTQFAVLDERDRPVAIGASGQLHIGGDGVARGYVERPALDAEKFVANPFGPGRLYRTGDSARMLRDGEVEILGRLDQQVKLRGFRIELGEIEAVLAQAPEISHCAIALREDVPGQARLVAYVVERRGASADTAALQRWLAQRLPDYMLPAAWVRLDALPALQNGKLDRAALPAPVAATSGEFVAPRTPAESALAEIWAQVLDVERVGVRDDLFALGADSIQLFQITARANRRGMTLAAKHLFRHRTIEDIVRNCESAAAPADAAGPGARPVLTVLQQPGPPRGSEPELQTSSRS